MLNPKKMANTLSSTTCDRLSDAVSPCGAKIVQTHNTFVHPCYGEVGVRVNPNLKDFFPTFFDSSDIVLSQPVVTCTFFFISFTFFICCFYFSHILAFQLEVDEWQPLFTAYQKSWEQVKHILQHWDLARGLLLVPLPDDEPSLVPREGATRKQVNIGPIWPSSWRICH